MPNKPRNPKHSLAFGQGYWTVRGDTKVEARWWDGAHWRSKTFHGVTLQDAIDRAEEHIRAESRRAPDADTHDWTVRELVDAWLRRGKTRWKPSTYATYRNYHQTHVAPVLGQLSARSVTTARLQQWIDDLNGKGLRPAMVCNVYLVISGAFKEAARLGIVRVNPAQGLTLPSVRLKPIVTWSLPDVQRVLDDVSGDPFWTAVYRFALTTGVRPGELRALKWADLDLEAGIVTVRRTMTRNEDYQFVVGDSTKTGSARVIALPPSTVAALREWRVRQLAVRLATAYWVDQDLVFTAATGDPLPQTTWQQYHKALCTRAKVPYITLHGTRHTFATLMMEGNEHPAIVQAMMGHSSISTTLDRYTHVSTALQERASEALEGRIAGRKTTQNG